MQDMRTYIAVNTSLLPLPRPMSPSDTEMWRSYPDDVEAMMKAGSQTWEPRMALTPFFAHEVCCLMTMMRSRRSLKSTACTCMLQHSIVASLILLASCLLVQSLNADAY